MYGLPHCGVIYATINNGFNLALNDFKEAVA